MPTVSAFEALRLKRDFKALLGMFRTSRHLLEWPKLRGFSFLLRVIPAILIRIELRGLRKPFCVSDGIAWLLRHDGQGHPKGRSGLRIAIWYRID